MFSIDYFLVLYSSFPAFCGTINWLFLEFHFNSSIGISAIFLYIVFNKLIYGLQYISLTLHIHIVLLFHIKHGSLTTFTGSHPPPINFWWLYLYYIYIYYEAFNMMLYSVLQMLIQFMQMRKKTKQQLSFVFIKILTTSGALYSFPRIKFHFFFTQEHLKNIGISFS